MGVRLHLECHKSIAAEFLIADQRRGGARKDSGDVDVPIAALHVELRKSRRHKLLHGNEGSLRCEAAIGARVFFQGGAFFGAGSKLRLTAGHALRQVFLFLFLLGHASKIPAYSSIARRATSG